MSRPRSSSTKPSPAPPPAEAPAGELEESSAAAFGLRLWDPQPLSPPRIDPSLPTLPALQRGLEVIIYSLAATEYWLSPGGWLRAWVRLNLLITIVLAVSGVTVLPIVTAVFTEMSTWTGLADSMVGDVTQSVRRLPPIAVAIGALFLLMHLYRRYRAHQRRKGYYQSDSYDDYQ